MLLVLTGAAGCADAIGFLALGHVFTANMSGNTALLGIYLARQDWSAALRSVLALGGFAAGLAMGASIAGRPGDGGPWPPAVTRALAFEGVVLAVVACGAWATASSRGILAGHALIALSAIAVASAPGAASVRVWRLMSR